MQSILDTITATVIEAKNRKQALCIRGGGSKDFYGNARALDYPKLEIGDYQGLTDYEPSELVVSARAGTHLSELEKLVGGQGQMLAFEPPYFNDKSTLGGCVATGLSGPRRPYAGAVRDHVLGIKILDGQGRILNFGGRVIKNVAGYDISRLMTGAMGTLGVILEVSLKVMPKPERDITLCFECEAVQAIAQMRQNAGQALPISATVYLNGQLHIRLSGIESAVSVASRKLGGDRLPYATSFWESIKNHSHPFFRNSQCLWRLSVNPGTPPLPFAGEQVIEWSGALRWLTAQPGADSTKIRDETARAGGHATLFRATDPNIPVFHPLAPPLIKIHQRLKRQFDPADIFNPQRMYPEF